MVDYSQIAMFTILAPIIIGVLSHLIAKLPKIGASLAKVTCIVTSYLVFFGVLSLVPVVASSPIKTQFLSFPLVTGTINMGFYVDFLALIPALLCSLFGALALTYNVYYLSPKNKAYSIDWKFNRSYSFILFFMGAMIGTLFSSDLIGLLIFWELVSICSYALISFWNQDPSCVKAALKCFIMTHIGSLALFITTITFLLTIGTVEIIELGQRIPLGDPVFLVAMPLIFISALPKTVQFPFHTWLPDGTVAPTSATVLFHVCGFQTGVYVIVRFFFQVFHSHVAYTPSMPFPSFFGNINIWNFVISLTGAVTLLIAALNGVIEKDFKRVVAYSTISELGYMVMVIGLATPLGVIAGLFHLMSHAFIAGLLFLCAGAVIYATGKHNINEMGGLHRFMPITTACCVICVLAIGAMPMLSEFAGKYLIIHSTLEVGSLFLLLVTVLGGVLHIAIVFRLLYSVFLTKTNIGSDSVIRDPPIFMLAPMIIMASIIITLGIVPTILLDFLILPGIQQLGFAANIVEPPGIVVPSLGFWSPLVVTVSMLVLLSVFVFTVTYFTKKATHRQKVSEDTFKPFLCGEDATTFYWPRSDHFYHTLTHVLKVDHVCHRLNIDRFYYSLSERFSHACTVLLQLDIQQRYMPAFLSFIIGVVILILIAILAV